MRLPTIALWILFGLVSATARAERCPLGSDFGFLRHCADLQAQASRWPEFIVALGMTGIDPKLQDPDCQHPQSRLLQALLLLERVDLPGVGNAFGYLAKRIDVTHVGFRLPDEPVAFFSSDRGLMINHAYFFEPSISPYERAAKLIHEARHSERPLVKHIWCRPDTYLAYQSHCDRRLETDLHRGEAISYEVVTLARIEALRSRCIDRPAVRRERTLLVETLFWFDQPLERERLEALASPSSARGVRSAAP